MESKCNTAEEFSQKDGCLHGKIQFIQDLVTYEAETVPELEKAFHAAVDDYLETLSLYAEQDSEDRELLRLLREAKAETYGQPLVSLEDVIKGLEG
ncbi:MAG: toxin-antitoxin system HicB family antitoxin [Verrucomicrobia bacterium]|nr:toxin-antitoxin system HicB family antitoxin [Verrucomicrobiota bacterium]MCH8526557.1 toxin-antitoxin system HicB family antitoxin [Kiritimatiellia bacterium]